jgi:hypothetical protein
MITAEQVGAINDPEFYSFNEFGLREKQPIKVELVMKWKI